MMPPKIFALPALPFTRQRPYWRWPSGKASLRLAPPAAPDHRQMVA